MQNDKKKIYTIIYIYGKYMVHINMNEILCTRKFLTVLCSEITVHYVYQ